MKQCLEKLRLCYACMYCILFVYFSKVMLSHIKQTNKHRAKVFIVYWPFFMEQSKRKSEKI